MLPVAAQQTLQRPKAQEFVAGEGAVTTKKRQR